MRGDRMRRLVVGATLAVLLPVLAACTSSSAGAPAPTHGTTVTATPSASPSPTAPIVAGPTTSHAATTCPWISPATTAKTMGERLGRVTVQVSGGTTVGCRFYGLQHPNSQCDATCLAGEHLPGPNQPVLQITTQRYPSAVAAHNAFVRASLAGRNPQQTPFGSTTGVCFQTAFYPKDNGQDWACTVNKGATMLLVNSVDTTGSYSVSTVTKAVLHAL